MADGFWAAAFFFAGMGDQILNLKF